MTQIKIKVKAKAKKAEINKVSATEYEVSVKEPAEDYKANVAVVKAMKKELGKGVKMISENILNIGKYEKKLAIFFFAWYSESIF